jgi:hypothetical protein
MGTFLPDISFRSMLLTIFRIDLDSSTPTTAGCFLRNVAAQRHSCVIISSLFHYPLTSLLQYFDFSRCVSLSLFTPCNLSSFFLASSLCAFFSSFPFVPFLIVLFSLLSLFLHLFIFLYFPFCFLLSLPLSSFARLRYFFSYLSKPTYGWAYLSKQTLIDCFRF